MILSIDRQIELMSREWPLFTVEKTNSRHAIWSGNLAPHKREYTLNIDYTAPLVIERYSAVWIQPLVSVAELAPWRVADVKLPSLPHVYWQHPRIQMEGPFLCLFDGQSRQWSSESAIAATTVAWSSLWLSFFEGWLLTGHWLGGGVHPVAVTR